MFLASYCLSHQTVPLPSKGQHMGNDDCQLINERVVQTKGNSMDLVCHLHHRSFTCTAGSGPWKWSERAFVILGGL